MQLSFCLVVYSLRLVDTQRRLYVGVTHTILSVQCTLLTHLVSDDIPQPIRSYDDDVILRQGLRVSPDPDLNTGREGREQRVERRDPREEGEGELRGGRIKRRVEI